MQLQRLKLVNFRQHADTELELGPGITAIVGPNGSGKTTLLEAISWAFFGNPAARGVKDSIRRHQAPARSQVRVEVDFSLGNHEFRVVRGLYNAELYQDGQDAPIANQSQEVAARVTRLLGMNREEFFNTYFTGQKELAVMASMGATERARFLSRVLGYAKLKLAQDRLRETRSRLRGEVTGLEQGLDDEDTLAEERERADRALATAREAVTAAQAVREESSQGVEAERPAWQQMVTLREAVLAQESERRVVERDVGEARREFERLDKELATALAAQTELQAIAADLERAPALKEEFAELDRQSRDAGLRRALMGQLSEVGEQRERVEQHLQQLADAPNALEGAQRTVEALRTEVTQAEAAEEKARTAWIRDRQDAETKRQALRDQYRDLHARRTGIVEAGADGECPTCTRPLGDEYTVVLASLDRQLEEIEINGKYFNKRVLQLEHEPQDVREAHERAVALSGQLEAQLQELVRAEDRIRERHDLEREARRVIQRQAEMSEQIAALPESYDVERHETVRAELRALEPVVERGAELRVKAERAEQLVGEAEAAEKALSALEDRLASLNAAIAAAGYSDDRYQSARTRFEVAEATLRTAELELASKEGDTKVAELALEQVQRRSDERAARVKRARRLRRDLTLHDELDTAFHDLRLELNATMRPELADRASTFLTELTDGRYTGFELDEHYRIVAVEDGLPKPVISGGEEDVTNLVLRLAISEMVAERAGQPLSLLVLDEVFGSLDEARRQNVVDLLRRLRDRFPQVVLITHIESVREGVDRVVRVSLDQHRATAVVSENGSD